MPRTPQGIFTVTLETTINDAGVAFHKVMCDGKILVNTIDFEDALRVHLRRLERARVKRDKE